MHFDLSIDIDRPPADCFAFLRDKDKLQQEPGSPVLVLDQTTDGPAGVGTRYREVVQMLPFMRGEILSEITRFEPPRFLEEDFTGPGMRGHLAYEFVPRNGGTTLIQRHTLQMRGLMKLFAGVVRRKFGAKIAERLEGVKGALESGYEVER